MERSSLRVADKIDPNSDRVILNVVDGVATISLVRTSQLNAFDEAMHLALREALAEIQTDTSVKVLVLTGSGRAFSAGQDLNERARTFSQGSRPDLGMSLEQNYNPLVRTIANMHIPVIAAVNGLAFGAGAAIAIACDIVLAASTARFQFGFVNVGLGPDSGASWTLPQLIGQARALDLALTGRPVTADEALAIGLVSRVIPGKHLQTTALAIAVDLASKSSSALAAIKHQIRTNASTSLDRALTAEQITQSELGLSDAYRDAVLHFTRPKT